MKFVNPIGLVQLALTDGQTTSIPSSGIGSIAWSTTLLSIMQYDGISWRAIGLANMAANTTSFATTSVVVIKATPGTLISVIVTAISTTVDTFIYDNASTASGTIIGVIPKSARIGDPPLVFNAPAKLGIVVGGQTGSASATILWS